MTELSWRAVPYGRSKTKRAMQYKKQKIKKTFFGKEKIIVEWIQPTYFIFLGDEYEEDFDYFLNWLPFFVETKEEFEEHKQKFNTLEKLNEFIEDNRKKAYDWWKPRREEFLAVWY